jgi:hypothetical protein
MLCVRALLAQEPGFLLQGIADWGKSGLSTAPKRIGSEASSKH